MKNTLVFLAGGIGLLNAPVWVYCVHRMNQLWKVIRCLSGAPCPALCMARPWNTCSPHAFSFPLLCAPPSLSPSVSKQNTLLPPPSWTNSPPDFSAHSRRHIVTLPGCLQPTGRWQLNGLNSWPPRRGLCLVVSHAAEVFSHRLSHAGDLQVDTTVAMGD